MESGVVCQVLVLDGGTAIVFPSSFHPFTQAAIYLGGLSLSSVLVS